MSTASESSSMGMFLACSRRRMRAARRSWLAVMAVKSVGVGGLGLSRAARRGPRPGRAARRIGVVGADDCLRLPMRGLRAWRCGGERGLAR